MPRARRRAHRTHLLLAADAALNLIAVPDTLYAARHAYRAQYYAACASWCAARHRTLPLPPPAPLTRRAARRAAQPARASTPW